jgi:hypothetical protein
MKRLCTNREPREVVTGYFIIGLPACRRLGEYVTLDKAFYNPPNKLLTQASRETDEHALPSTKEVTVPL